MNHQVSGDDNKLDQDKHCIEALIKCVKEFDPEKTVGSWSPDEGGEIIVALNKLHETLIKKAAEIKLYVRTLTVEELNELDGFARPQVPHTAANSGSFPNAC